MEEIGIRRECEELPFFVKTDKTPLVQEGKKRKKSTILFLSILFVRKLFWMLQWTNSGCHRE